MFLDRELTELAEDLTLFGTRVRTFDPDRNVQGGAEANLRQSLDLCHPDYGPHTQATGADSDTDNFTLFDFGEILHHTI